MAKKSFKCIAHGSEFNTLQDAVMCDIAQAVINYIPTKAKFKGPLLTTTLNGDFVLGFTALAKSRGALHTLDSMPDELAKMVFIQEIDAITYWVYQHQDILDAMKAAKEKALAHHMKNAGVGDDDVTNAIKEAAARGAKES